MTYFILRRLVQSVIVMLVVALIAFILFRFAGDPVAQLLGTDVPAAQQQEMRDRLGLDEPLVTQYFRFIGRVVRGEFGISYQMAQPVTDMILVRIPATVELSFVAALFSLLVGIPMGIYTALKPERWLSKLFLSLSLIGVSLPSFFVGILLIYIFGVALQVLPTFGRGEVVQIGWWTTGFLTQSGLKSLILPTITLGLFQLTLIMRLVRSEMLEVLRTDYIRFARARGLRQRAINLRHALKNTLVPVITITGLQVGSITAFAIITETVFQWPGLGLMFLKAIEVVDIPVMSTYLLLIGFFFVLVNLTVDLLYLLTDPRLRTDGGILRRSDG